MAYSTSNPPALVYQVVGGSTGTTQNARVWMYTSSDPIATVDASGYFTNGYKLGMRDGNLCNVYDTVNKIWSSSLVNESSQVISLGTGTTVGSSADAD